jgi:hypothetical protein
MFNRAAGMALLIASALTIFPSGARAQEPETRAETLRREREQKSTQLEPAAPSRLERLLLDLESGRLLERVLNPAEGLYPRIGTITPGSGFSVGPAYRTPGRFGGHADLSAFAAASLKKYWMIEARMRMPRLLDERLALDVHAQKYDFPEEDFFGLGPDSARDAHVTYGLANSVIGGGAGYAPVRWLTLSGTGDFLAPRISPFNRDEAIGTRFDDRSAPGLLEQPDFMRWEAMADVNFREPRGNPRRGGRYALAFQRFDDVDGSAYSFNRVEADLQQYVPLLRDRRVLAFRALASISDADDGARIPFYLQRTLGGPDDLRGFRRFRFRDRHALLLQAEYRWEIFTAVDGAIFYDAGKVASRLEDLTLKDLESDYGVGFRFGTRNGVFLRVEGAFGSSGGKHFIFRFGHVF